MGAVSSGDGKRLIMSVLLITILTSRKYDERFYFGGS